MTACALQDPSQVAGRSAGVDEKHDEGGGGPWGREEEEDEEEPAAVVEEGWFPVENKLSIAARPLLDAAAATFFAAASRSSPAVLPPPEVGEDRGTADSEGEEAEALAAEMNSFLPTPSVRAASAAEKFGRLE